MAFSIQVENIKCGGCANSIRKKLLALDGVSAVEVQVEDNIVEVEAAAEQKPSIIEALLSMGYPEAGSVHGLASASSKAKSFVSCAIGRMSDTPEAQ